MKRYKRLIKELREVRKIYLSKVMECIRDRNFKRYDVWNNRIKNIDKEIFNLYENEKI